MTSSSSRGTADPISIFIFSILFPSVIFAQESNAGNQSATVFFSPSTQTIIRDSTFDVSVFIDTHGQSVNSLDMKINFNHSFSISRK
jgi:hypothetical protein